MLKKKSAILFTKRAFIAALTAITRVCQKLISKKEHKPTPSQPRNKIKKLFPVTKRIIKKVNKDRYDINLYLFGSSTIYSREYT